MWRSGKIWCVLGAGVLLSSIPLLAGELFGPARLSFPAGSSSHSIAVGDFNADGAADLAVANQEGVSILLGDGLGGVLDSEQFDVTDGLTSVAVYLMTSANGSCEDGTQYCA